ncbi:MAG: hypothetical protein ACI4WX_12210 [Aristaeellaceae bacterium]
MTLQPLACAEELDSCNIPAAPEKVSTRTETVACEGRPHLPADSFVVARVRRRCCPGHTQ